MEVSEVDWEKGLPIGVLALVARGAEELKVMREVCKTWEEGFECSVTTIRIGKEGPLPPPTLCERYPALTCLDLGESFIDENALAILGNLKKLISLILGATQRDPRKFWDLEDGQLAKEFTGTGLEHVRGLSLQTLSLSGCANLSLQPLNGLPLTSLSLYNCYKLMRTDASWEFLRGLPLTSFDAGETNIDDNVSEYLRGKQLTSLNIDHCFGFSDAGLAILAGMPLTVLDLSGIAEVGHLTDAGLAHLRGMPLTSFSLTQGYYYITDDGIDNLRGMPLTYLEMAQCWDLTDGALEPLMGMPLTYLGLMGWEGLSDTGLLLLRGMPLKYLDIRRCFNITNRGLAYLRGLPLTKLLVSIEPEGITREGVAALQATGVLPADVTIF